MSNNTPFTAEAFQEDLAFIKENNINVLFVEPDAKKGFEFPYLVYLPQNPQATLIMDCLNDYEAPIPNNTTENLSAIQEVYSFFEEMRVPSDHSPFTTGKIEETKQATLDRLYYRLGKGINTLANLVNDRFQDAPIMVPLIPGYTDKAGMSELGAHIAKEFSPQIVAMIQDAQNLVSERTNIQLNDKIMTYGHSKSSTFANNFTTLHPEMVQSMILAGTEDFTLPISEIALRVVEDSEKSKNEQFKLSNGRVTKKITKAELGKIITEYNATKKEHQADITLNSDGSYSLPLNFPVGIADIEQYIDLSQFPGGKAEYQKILSALPRTLVVGEREEEVTGHYAYSDGQTLDGISVKSGDDLGSLNPNRKITEIERASMHNRVLEYIAASQALFGKSANERLRNYMQLCDVLGVDAQSKIYQGIGHVDVYSSPELRADCKQYYEALVLGQDLTLGDNGRVSRINPIYQLKRRLSTIVPDDKMAQLESDSILMQKLESYLASKGIPDDTNMDKVFDELTVSELSIIFGTREKLFTESDIGQSVEAISPDIKDSAASHTRSDLNHDKIKTVDEH